jgi:hypothetical protein
MRHVAKKSIPSRDLLTIPSRLPALFLAAVLLTIFLLFRLYNLKAWLLANLDEISLMNNISLPMFSGGYGSTTFFPAAQITRYFPFIASFPEYRAIGVLFNAVGMLFFYAGLRNICGGYASLLGALLFSMQWYLVYISRIYEIATFIPFFFSIVFYLFTGWLVSKKDYLLPLLFFIGGIGLDCYAPPMAYSLAALFVIVSVSAFKKNLRWRWILMCLLSFTVAILPFVYVQLFVGNFFRDLLANYNHAASPQSQVTLIHLQEPSIFFSTLTELMTFLTLQHRWQPLVLPAVMILLLPIYPVVCVHRNRNIFMIALWTYLTLVITFCSPIAAYIQGHFTGFLILFCALVATLMEAPETMCRRISCLAALLLVIFSLYWMPVIRQNQYRDIAWLPDYLRNENLASVPVSDGAYLALKHTPFLRGADFPVFLCNSTPEIEGFLSSLPPEKRRLVIATFNCDIAGAISNLGMTVSREQRITTLFESYLTEGIVFYFLENIKGAAGMGK